MIFRFLIKKIKLLGHGKEPSKARLRSIFQGLTTPGVGDQVHGTLRCELSILHPRGVYIGTGDHPYHLSRRYLVPGLFLSKDRWCCLQTDCFEWSTCSTQSSLPGCLALGKRSEDTLYYSIFYYKIIYLGTFKSPVGRKSGPSSRSIGRELRHPGAGDVSPCEGNLN